jgi:hypothetical protein
MIGGLLPGPYYLEYELNGVVEIIENGGLKLKVRGVKPGYATFWAYDYTNDYSNTLRIHVPWKSCKTPCGTTIEHGASITAYNQASARNCSLFAQVRTCNNGVLSGSYGICKCDQVDSKR